MTNTFLTTSVVVGGIEGIQHIPAPNGTIEIIKLAIQAVVAIVGLFKMFKKPKEVKEEINNNI